MKFKKMAALLMAGAMVFGMGIPVSAEEKEGADEITIWAWDEAFNIKAANVAKDMYAEANPDVKVNVVTMAQDDIVAKLNTSLASGSYEGLPDIVLIEDYRIQGYLNAYPDEFADLSDIASPDDFAEYKTGVNQVDGKMYGIPFDSGVAAVFYRTDYIEEAGYTTEDMQDLTWYTDEEGNVTIKDNQALKDAITTYKKIVDSGISKQVADWDQFVGAFNSGDVASVPTGCWISPSVLNAEDQSGKWAVAPFPRMAENEASVNASSIGGAGWYVLKNVGHEDAAKAFLKETFASSTELMNQLATDINLVSTLKASSEAENYNKGVDFYGGQEIFKDFAEWTNEVPSVNYGEDTYAIEDIMTEVVQAVVGGADIDETLEMYQTQIEGAVAN